MDEGRLEWDRPVREVLPDLRLLDEVATNHLTVRDLLSHRSGLPRHDLAWYGDTVGRSELLARLRGDNLLLLFGHAARTGKIETTLAWWPEIEQVGVDTVRAEVLIFLNSLILGDRLERAAAPR